MQPDAPLPIPTPGCHLTQLDERTWAVRAGSGTRVALRVPAGPVVVLDDVEGERFMLPGRPGDEGVRLLRGRGACWVLPDAADSPDPAWLIAADGGVAVEARFGAGETVVVVDAPAAIMTRHRARPHADVTGAGFALDLPGGEALADALAGFYWGTMLPCVVERTVARRYADADGYVVSTLAPNAYRGTYPDVDHEFQIKGRMAMGDAVDLDVVRRMIELQLRLMREDPAQLWRDPCAVQPDGDREYHVRRNSLDGSENAVMFLVSGNIEVVESIWLYIARTRDLDWLRARLGDIEGAVSLVEDCIDRLGRLWSDVFYEDQVIKDGRETMSSALAIRSFRLLAELEELLGYDGRAAHYRTQADGLAAALMRPLPIGYWDPKERRFVDWVDRMGRVHDHIHLLANILPPLVGSAKLEQTSAVIELIDRELEEFQRFPTVLAARISDYTPSEMGVAGPFDLCAAGRYWCWDAAFWSWRGNGQRLRRQLDRVAAEGAAHGWFMGERYHGDRDVFSFYGTNGGSPWHGASYYYEYPCVFAWVLMHEYLGVRAALDADLRIAPRVSDPATVTLGQDAYRLRYRVSGGSFSLENLADHPRTFLVDLSALAGYDGAEERLVELHAGATATLTPADMVATVGH
jgi:hypothetical protein